MTQQRKTPLRKKTLSILLILGVLILLFLTARSVFFRGGQYDLTTTEGRAAYPRALEKMQSAYPVLNESERRVVILSFLGFRAKEVADLLGLTENTARKYRSNIRKKVGDNPFSSFWE